VSKKDKFSSLLGKKSEDQKPKGAHSELLNETDGNNYTSVDTNVNASENELDDIANRIASQSKKNKPKKFEDTHSKATYWIRNDVLKAFNKIAGSERGKKTEIINQALIDYFVKLEKEMDNE
jgi:hypothetical protein